MRSCGLLCTLVIAAGCGRIGFDRPDGGAPTGDGNPSLCAQSPSLICDSFEGTTIDARWVLDNSLQGHVSIDRTRAMRGGSSMFVTTDPVTTTTQYPRASVETHDTFPVTGRLYARVFIDVSQLPSAMFVQLLNFANESGQGISMGVRNGKVVTNDYTAIAFAESVTTPFPIDRWTCVQFEIPSGTSGETRVFIDGAEVTDVKLTKGTVQPQPTHIYVGIDWPATVASFARSSAWFDEFVLDSSPTSCAN